MILQVRARRVCLLEILWIDTSVDIFDSIVALNSIGSKLLQEEVQIDKVQV